VILNLLPIEWIKRFITPSNFDPPFLLDCASRHLLFPWSKVAVARGLFRAKGDGKRVARSQLQSRVWRTSCRSSVPGSLLFFLSSWLRACRVRHRVLSQAQHKYRDGNRISVRVPRCIGNGERVSVFSISTDRCCSSSNSSRNESLLVYSAISKSPPISRLLRPRKGNTSPPP
jgi:hypothetical protein